MLLTKILYYNVVITTATDSKLSIEKVELLNNIPNELSFDHGKNEFEMQLKQLEENIKNIEKKFPPIKKSAMSKEDYQLNVNICESDYAQKLFTNAEIFTTKKYRKTMIHYALLSIMFKRKNYHDITHHIDGKNTIEAFSKSIKNELKKTTEENEICDFKNFFMHENICRNLIVRKFVDLYKKNVNYNEIDNLELLLICDYMLEVKINEYFDIREGRDFLNRSAKINKNFFLHDIINRYANDLNITIITHDDDQYTIVMKNIVSCIYGFYEIKYKKRFEKDQSLIYVTFSEDFTQDLEKTSNENKIFYNENKEILEVIFHKSRFCKSNSFAIMGKVKDIYNLISKFMSLSNSDAHRNLLDGIPDYFSLSDFLKFIGLYTEIDANCTKYFKNDVICLKGVRYIMTNQLEWSTGRFCVNIEHFFTNWLDQHKDCKWTNLSNLFQYMDEEKPIEVSSFLHNYWNRDFLEVYLIRSGKFAILIEKSPIYLNQYNHSKRFAEIIDDIIVRNYSYDDKLLIKTALKKFKLQALNHSLGFNDCRSDVKKAENSFKQTNKLSKNDQNTPNDKKRANNGEETLQSNAKSGIICNNCNPLRISFSN